MSSDEEVIVLYDLASKPPVRCFSPNCWKTRAALNFKGLNYKTIWLATKLFRLKYLPNIPTDLYAVTSRLEWPDVKETLQPLGIQGNRPEEYPLEYTCPTVKLPDGRYIMDSAKIAPELEKMPGPSLHLDGPLEQVSKALGNLFGALMPSLLYKVRDGLSERSAEYYEVSRKQLFFGMGLDELAQSEAAKNTWTNAEVGIKEVGSVLRKFDGPYVMGTTACYADLILAAGWHCLFELDPPTLEKLYTYDAAFEKHYEACKVWFQRDSY